ncbi:MAG: sulfite exporter TauE/SafE family protein [Alphaproteobacteria bacterium]|nr:sulfite exporter TauE/SafE family protein [Alphaproteobacteria bacterium]
METQFLGIPGIDGLVFSGLALASFCTAFFGMITGAGGGPILLALMAMVMPPSALIPVHTVVQLGVGSSRTIILWRFILWPTMLPFLIGAVIGAAVAAPIFVSLPTAVLQGIIGLFILLVAWMPEIGRIGPERGRFALLGFGMTFLAMFVSSTGSLLAPFVASISPDRRNYASTTASLMSMSHIIKLVAFGLMGFAIGAYLPLMAAMVGTATLGNWLGKKVLVRIREDIFRWVLKALLSLLALRLLWIAATSSGLL